MLRYATNKWVKIVSEEREVVVFGATEPIFSILDYEGFRIEKIFLIGLSDTFGDIVLETKDRAQEAVRALDLSYRAKIEKKGGPHWWVSYSLKDKYGNTPSRLVADMVLKDGTQVLKNGYLDQPWTEDTP